MNGTLNSLTDVLKKTLFFFESLSVAELTPYVHRQMLVDYSAEQVEEKFACAWSNINVLTPAMVTYGF